MENQLIKLSDLRKVKGIGSKTLVRIKDTLLSEVEYISEYNPNIHLDVNSINHGDCLELMNGIKDKSVDMVLCDLPYGTTRNAWDSIIPFEKLWKQYERIIKDNGAIILTAQTPFDKVLGASNLELLRYEWIWEKNSGTGHLNANRMPMKNHENVLVFYKNLPTYNPQMTKGIPYKGRVVTSLSNGTNYGQNVEGYTRSNDNDGTRYPVSVQRFDYERGLHPTQKPVELFEYLIKTYTNEGDIVLDNCLGSGTTAVAAINTDRKYIGIEMDKKYYELSVNRVEEVKSEMEKYSRESKSY